MHKAKWESSSCFCHWRCYTQSCWTRSRPVYLMVVHAEMQRGANWRHIHLSLGNGVPSENLAATISLKSQTDTTLIICNTLECLQSSTVVPTSSSRYSLVLCQKTSNLECLPLKWFHRSYTKDGSSTTNTVVTLALSSIWIHCDLLMLNSPPPALCTNVLR